MKELALHILDIAQNSIRGNATKIDITIIEDIEKDRLKVEIKDNGIGIDKDLIEKVADPFFTTRNTRKVGLGLSLFKAAAQQCDGDLRIYSKKGEGTTIIVDFKYSHIDRAPLGSMEETLISLIASNEVIDYSYTHYYNKNKFHFNTAEIKEVLKDVKITEVSVLLWLKEYIQEGLKDIV